MSATLSAEIQYFEKDFDPGTLREERMFRLQPDDGVQVLSANVQVVDSNAVPILDTDLIIDFVSLGIISDGVWGVTFYLHGGTAGKTYLLRCTYTLSTMIPADVGKGITMRLRVKHT